MHRKIVPGVLAAGAPVPRIAADADVRAAAKAMAAAGTDALAVVDGDGGFQGIVTAADLARRGLASGADPDRQPVADVMTARPDTLAPTDTVHDAFALMRGRGLCHLAVVEGGKPLGVVSLGSVAAALADALDRAGAETEAAVFGPAGGGGPS